MRPTELYFPLKANFIDKIFSFIEIKKLYLSKTNGQKCFHGAKEKSVRFFVQAEPEPSIVNRLQFYMDSNNKSVDSLLVDCFSLADPDLPFIGGPRPAWPTTPETEISTKFT